MIIPELITENGFVLEGFLTSCSFNYLNREKNSRIYMLILFIGGFGIPVSTLCVFYSLMFFELITKKKKLQIQSLKHKIIKKVSVKFNSKSENCSNIIFEEESEKKTKDEIKTKENKNLFSDFFLKRETQAARNSILIILLFCIAWTPYAVITLIAQFGTNIENYINPYSTSFSAIIAKLPAISDPLIYTLSNKGFRTYFKTVCKKTFSKSWEIRRKNERH